MNRPAKIGISFVLSFFIARAVAEPFVTRPGLNYKYDWGGPTYIGVLAVHMLPGVIALWLLWLLWHKRSN